MHAMEYKPTSEPDLLFKVLCRYIVVMSAMVFWASNTMLAQFWAYEANRCVCQFSY